MCMTCTGGGGKSSSSRSPTSKPYTPPQRTTISSRPSGAGSSKQNTFGTPKVKLKFGSR